jgi:hypothetical protein
MAGLAWTCIVHHLLKGEKPARGGFCNWLIILVSFVEAESHEAAAKAFENHPHLQIPQSSIEVMYVRPM